ncbi:hypothetical protein HPP92_021147 [Vanilla planifolia]|uniref:THH1/TOM1/TOM3 domain-containing protein n=1 Tax=Vanilla planifolia TaxID=51239 RepID=A0A835UKF7_VANPL|nr:hypothetical protein HPP92_021147 [Vanilla planifolia]
MPRRGVSVVGRCPSAAAVVGDSALIVVDMVIAAVAFFQLWRIHIRSQQLGWTRQKVFHLMIGLCNTGYILYFICSLVANCQGWMCWSRGCGFVLMACPQILLLATFLLLLSFWTDLCHQSTDDEEDDDDISESFLEKSNIKPEQLHFHARCCSFGKVRLGSRQKYVILVIMLTFVFMVAMALLILIGRGKNPIDSLLVATVYLDVFSVCIIILGVGLASYGGILFSKMRKVRSEMASTEMWKVASLAAVSLVCFTSSSVVALTTRMPMLSYEHLDEFDSIKCSVFIFLYYIVGSSVPSSYVLWSMKEMPSSYAVERIPQTRVVTIFRESPLSAAPPNPQWRATVTNSQNKALKVSPI